MYKLDRYYIVLSWYTGGKHCMQLDNRFVHPNCNYYTCLFNSRVNRFGQTQNSLSIFLSLWTWTFTLCFPFNTIIIILYIRNTPFFLTENYCVSVSLFYGVTFKNRSRKKVCTMYSARVHRRYCIGERA